MHLGDPPALPFKIGFENGRCLFFGPIGRRHGASQNQVGIKIRGDVPLVAVESLALALPAVAHLRILDGNAPFGGHAFANARASTAVGIWFEILGANLCQRVQMVLQWRLTQLLG